MNKKVLIVCYSFPPYPGIGGRRWAKFSKYIKLLGTEVFVISSKNPFNEKSNWTTDIEGINVTRLPLIYPKALISFPKSFTLLEKSISEIKCTELIANAQSNF